ncbi:MAG: hypothetical protein IT381_08130 [Deltaproteobacteria bacterium]|nr:hypothetical protein [Deltaproteobacteria bacterium]
MIAIAAEDPSSQPASAQAATSAPVFAPPAAPGSEADEAEVAHAEGLLAETDGRVDEARRLLSRASELVPANVDFAFDLARVSFERKLPTLATDISRFLTLEPKTAGQSLLRGYLLAMLRTKDGARATEDAKAAVQRSLALDPTNSEAQQLGVLLDKPPIGKRSRKNWALRAKIATEYDSNVTLIQDATPSDEGGLRLLLSGGVAWQPSFGETRLSLSVDLSGGIHLMHRDRLALFDFAQVLPRFSVDSRVGDNRLIAAAFISQVFLQGFTRHFMQDFALVAEYRRIFGEVWQPGLYAGIGYRDFTTGDFNQPGPTDRDGLHTNVGLGLNFVRDDVVAHVRAGFQLENAAGAEQRELGPEADMLLRFTVSRFSFGATLAYMGRFYQRSSTMRVDQRVSAGFVASVTVTPWLFIDVDYRFVRNVSPAVVQFDYMRHLTGVTLRAAY